MKHFYTEKRIFLFIIVISIMAFLSTNYIYKNGFNGPPIRSDGKGYYVYLPSFFIGHSFQVQTDEYTPYWYVLENGNVVDSYPMGTAILQIPFFLAAHAFTLLSDPAAADGWSAAYQAGNIVSAIVYYAFGIFFLYQILRRYFDSRVSIAACVLISIGTNLFNYLTHDASFSHIYSFSVMVFFLYHLVTYEEDKKEFFEGGGIRKTLNLMVFGILAGIIFLVRNTNIVYVLLYVFYGVDSIAAFRKRLAEIVKPANSLPVLIAGAVVISPQLIYWKKVTGHFLFVSYQGTDLFDWLSPHIWNVLFSVRKGALFWCPLLIFAVWGIGVKNEKLANIRVAGIIFFLLNLYIISSWYCWPYGGSLGQRPFIDSYGLMAVYLANFLEMLSLKIEHAKYRAAAKALAVLLFLAVIAWSLCITWGYWVHLIPYDGATLDTLRQFIKYLAGMVKGYG